MQQSTFADYERDGVPCPDCNRVFDSERGMKIHNSHVHHDPIFAECAWCGDEVQVPRSHAEPRGDYPLKNHFCDKECETEYKAEHWVGENHPSWEGGQVELECGTCGKMIYRNPAQVSETANFCSRACRNKYGMQELVELVCPICDTEFQRKPWEIRGDTALCSHDCWREFMSSLRRGEKNPAWRGGKAEYYGPDWPQQRRATLERDDYTCQLCGMGETEHRETYSRQLHVHHIQRFKAFDGDHEAANALTNLVVVCPPCHGALEQQDEATQRDILTTAAPKL